MIFSGEGYIFSEPGRRDEGQGVFLALEFNLHKQKRCELLLEDVKLCSQTALEGDHVTFLADHVSVDLGEKMFIGFPGQRKIIFLSCHKALGLIGEFVLIIVPADPYHRGSVQISLRDRTAGIIRKVFGQPMYEIFAFDFQYFVPPVWKSL